MKTYEQEIAECIIRQYGDCDFKEERNFWDAYDCEGGYCEGDIIPEYESRCFSAYGRDGKLHNYDENVYDLKDIHIEITRNEGNDVDVEAIEDMVREALL